MNTIKGWSFGALLLVVALVPQTGAKSPADRYCANMDTEPFPIVELSSHTNQWEDYRAYAHVGMPGCELVFQAIIRNRRQHEAPVIFQSVVMARKDAVKTARWILDTFGEK